MCVVQACNCAPSQRKSRDLIIGIGSYHYEDLRKKQVQHSHGRTFCSVRDHHFKGRLPDSYNPDREILSF